MDIDKIKHMIDKIGSGEYKDGSSMKKGWLYHNIPFSEFSDIPTHKPCVSDESDYILRDIFKNFKDMSKLNVLDIGCANGLYSYKLSEHCTHIVAYEGDIDSYKVDEAVAEYKNINNIKFINKYFDGKEADSIDEFFDICLMLNVHMWIHKQIGSKKCFEMMKYLSTKVGVIYFQTAHLESKGKYLVKELRTTQEVKMYLKNCGFLEVVHMKDTLSHGKKRSLFKCTNNLPKKNKTSNISFKELEGEMIVVKKITNNLFNNFDHGISLDKLLDNEVFWLNKFEYFDRVPKLLSFDFNSKEIIMEYVGEKINRHNIPDDWELQMGYIINALKEHRCKHNDITPDEILVKNGIIYLIDFGWASKLDKVDYSDFPPMLGGNFKSDYGFNDEDSFRKSVLHVIDGEEK